MERCFTPECYLEFYFPPLESRGTDSRTKTLQFMPVLYMWYRCVTQFLGASLSTELGATVQNVKLNLTL